MGDDSFIPHCFRRYTPREIMRVAPIKKSTWALLLIFGIVFSSSIAGGMDTPAEDTRVEKASEISSSSDAPIKLGEKWGVNIMAVRTTAEGFMLDFRYRVTDPEKSVKLLDRKVTPILVDQKSGAKIPVVRSRFGPMRQTTTKPTVNRVYTIIFSNPNKSVKKGDKVTVELGEFKAENLVVQ